MLDWDFNKLFLITYHLQAVIEFLNIKLYVISEIKLLVKFSMKDTFKNRLMNFWLCSASNYWQKFSAAKLFTPWLDLIEELLQHFCLVDKVMLIFKGIN